MNILIELEDAVTLAGDWAGTAAAEYINESGTEDDWKKACAEFQQAITAFNECPGWNDPEIVKEFCKIRGLAFPA